MSDVPQAPRRSRFWLIASLCLNFFFIGLIVAGLVVARNRMIAGAASEGYGNLPPEVLLQLLPPAGGVKMCNVIDANLETFRKLGRDLVDTRRAVFRAFRAEPFDSAAFKAAVERSTAAQIALVRLKQDVGVQVTETLDANERQELARKLVQRFFGGQRERQDHPTLRELCAAARAQATTQPR